MFHTLRRGALVGLLAALALWPAGAAFALDKVRLGKAVPNSFAFGATEVGIEAKIFEQEGLEIEVTSFRGDAQLQQALAAGSLDVALARDRGSASAPRARLRSALLPCTDRRQISRSCFHSTPRSRPSAISRASVSG